MYQVPLGLNILPPEGQEHIVVFYCMLPLLVYLEAPLKMMQANVHASEVGMLTYFHIKNELLSGHWPQQNTDHLQSLSELVGILILQ